MIWLRMELLKLFHITLKYGEDKNRRSSQDLKRISKPGLRVYAGKDELPKVLGGLGIAILSTNKAYHSKAKPREAQRRGTCICLW